MENVKKEVGPKRLIGKSAIFTGQVEKIFQIAKYNIRVLIVGETGTGKEIFARTIHDLSPRADKPFVPVNCGAIPLELAENELFGHKPGAFTGAAKIKKGLIEEAQGGTLFLDEIDSLPLLVQVKLLRFLQEKTYRPLGSTIEHQADVRIIAATNANVEEAVQQGKLRRDLYYRLNVVTIHLPSLRERKEDIPLLARYFLRKFAMEIGKEIKGFSENAIRKLVAYEWPGNIRELEHVIERTVVFCEKEMIKSQDVVLPSFEDEEELLAGSFNEAKRRFVTEFEKRYVTKLLLAYEGNISRAARAAGKNRRAFFELIWKHKIDVKKMKPER